MVLIKVFIQIFYFDIVVDSLTRLSSLITAHFIIFSYSALSETLVLTTLHNFGDLPQQKVLCRA